MIILANEDNNEHYGVYRIVRELEDKRPAHGSKVYLMECTVCGTLRELRKIDAIKVDSCKHICTGGRRSVKHGTWKNKRIAGIFASMVYRCHSEKSKSYKFYGAKGIRVCDEWLNDPSKFEEWAVKNGYQDDLTIDRIDSNKGYEPDNCRWIPQKLNSQLGGMAGCKYIEVDGVKKSCVEWSSACNVSHNVINTMRRTYGEDKTIEFIRLRLKSPDRKMEKGFHGWLYFYGLVENPYKKNKDAEILDKT